MAARLICGVLAIAACGVAAAQQQPTGQPLVVFFDWAKPDVRSDDQLVLDQAADAWRFHPGALLHLSGHTDRSGSAAFNLRASRNRAAMVRDELVKRGVPASAIAVEAFGEARPLVPTEDGVREVQNRRVEILVLEAGGGAAVTAASAGGMPVPFAIRGPNGEPRGFATFLSDGKRTSIKVEASGLPPGVHGIHLHSVGKCDGPDFKSAGGHWNPTGKQHGHDNPMGAHRGDLANLTVAADGKGSANFSVEGDMEDIDGTSLVIHADPDDYRTDPSGNSGARIACAVLTSAQ